MCVCVRVYVWLTAFFVTVAKHGDNLSICRQNFLTQLKLLLLCWLLLLLLASQAYMSCLCLVADVVAAAIAMMTCLFA